MKRYLIILVLLLCSAVVLFAQEPKDSDTVWVKEIGSDVLQVKFSPDGEKIYIGAANYKPFVVATATGETLREFEQSFVSVTAMDLSKDGNYLAVAGSSGEKASLIDVNTGSIVVDYKVPNEIFAKFDYKVIYSASLSSDMQYFAMLLRGNDSQLELISYVIIWNALTGEYVNSIGYPFTQRAIFSPLGNQIALCTDQADKPNKILLYNTIDWKQEQTLCCHSNMITDISFSPDGSLLASCGWDGEIKIWDVKNAKLIKEIKETYIIYSIGFIDNDKLITGGGYFDKKYMKIWSLNSDEALGMLKINHPLDLDISNNLHYCVVANSTAGILLFDYMSLLTSVSNSDNTGNQVVPNPSSNIFNIKVLAPKFDYYEISIYDANMRLLNTIYQGDLEPGLHTLSWSSSNYSNGLYYCVIHSESYNETLKIMVQK